MLCASCIRALREAPRSGRGRLSGMITTLRCAAGVALCFVFFYTMGRFLLTMPAQYHEGTLWQTTWERMKTAAQGEP